MALALVEAFRQQAMRAAGKDAEVVVATAQAVAAMLAAIAAASAP